jgi:hypothetical protein
MAMVMFFRARSAIAPAADSAGTLAGQPGWRALPH